MLFLPVYLQTQMGTPQRAYLASWIQKDSNFLRQATLCPNIMVSILKFYFLHRKSEYRNVSLRIRPRQSWAK